MHSEEIQNWKNYPKNRRSYVKTEVTNFQSIWSKKQSKQDTENNFLGNDLKIFSPLYNASQSENGNLDAFIHENGI